MAITFTGNAFITITVDEVTVIHEDDFGFAFIENFS